MKSKSSNATKKEHSYIFSFVQKMTLTYFKYINLHTFTLICDATYGVVLTGKGMHNCLIVYY